MKKDWSKEWKSSSQPRKQRKYRAKAPLHVKHKLVSSHLSKELRKEYGVRSIPVRKGDSVKIMIGSFKNFTGRVTKVSLAREFAHVEGAAVTRSDGTKSLYPLNPSNLLITKLDNNDKKRVQKLEKLKTEAKKSQGGKE